MNKKCFAVLCRFIFLRFGYGKFLIISNKNSLWLPLVVFIFTFLPFYSFVGQPLIKSKVEMEIRKWPLILRPLSYPKYPFVSHKRQLSRPSLLRDLHNNKANKVFMTAGTIRSSILYIAAIKKTIFNVRM